MLYKCDKCGLSLRDCPCSETPRERSQKSIFRREDIIQVEYEETIRQIFECWHGKIGLNQMSAYDIVESIENVVQQRLPGFDAYASTPK